MEVMASSYNAWGRKGINESENGDSPEEEKQIHWLSSSTQISCARTHRLSS